MKMNRRTFIGLAAPAFIPNLISAPRNSTLRLGAFGAGGMAYITLDLIANHPKVQLACVADVDSAHFDKVSKKYPNAKTYADWRKMLDEQHKELDIACIGTPDHMHAPTAMSSMQLGLHVYVQKPLTHDLHEARRLTAMARKKKLVTQMGIQRHSSSEYLTSTQLVQSGAIGKVKEVYAWSEKKWGDPEPMPDRSDPVPSTLDWDLWLGVAEKRPYLADYYHPRDWRKRIDFGTATFGDMGCHIFDPIFSALMLTSPVSLRSEGPAPTGHNWALNSVIHYVFPGTRYTDGKTINIHWYDGDERPPADVKALIGKASLPGQGSIFIGEKGVMLLPHTGEISLFPEDQFKGFEIKKIEDVNHYHQFVEAVLGNGKTTTHFDYAGPLTEAVLLGPLATRFPKTTLEWSASKLKFGNSAEATHAVRRKYRAGWSVSGLS
jgi:predicted dehydrogenase